MGSARRTAGMLLGTVGALALGVSVAWAGGLNISAQDDFYVGATHTIDEGEQSRLTNQGPDNTHTITADESGPDGKALFRTGNVPVGQNLPVNGSQFLDAGSYDFHCSIHPADMQATLEVDNSASGPQERPEISVKLKSKKLTKVVDSKQLKVEVTAAEPTDADGVSLSAKKGRKVITKRGGASFDLDAGETDTAKLRLKTSAVKKLKELEKARVKVTGEVDFGSPAKANRKLK